MEQAETVIQSVKSYDARYPLPAGAGSDAVHSEPEYCLAVTRLKTNRSLTGTGIALTLGEGNRFVCEIIEHLASALAGKEIESLMSGFGAFSRSLADHPQLRWLGPHKGAVHLALASLTNACFDLWAKARGVPLWRLLLDLTPEQVIALLDLSYLEEVLTPGEALALLKDRMATRAQREGVLKSGFPGYDTSVGWFGYDDEKVRDNARRALDDGFRAFKLKVGSPDGQRDIGRAHMLRELVGPHCLLMLDANQQWTLPRALEMCHAFRDISPYWIEEPTHPDDIAAHRKLARAISPLRVALGEHVPNRVMFKNFIEEGAVHFVQVDCTRVAGVSEFLGVSLLAKRFGLPVVPHVGDMGQIHQHLVLFNQIAVGVPILFLEYIPHLRQHFVHPARVEKGFYKTPEIPGSSCDLVELADAVSGISMAAAQH
jgi:L-fuconate dehydratase